MMPDVKPIPGKVKVGELFELAIVYGPGHSVVRALQDFDANASLEEFARKREGLEVMGVDEFYDELIEYWEAAGLAEKLIISQRVAAEEPTDLLDNSTNPCGWQLLP